MSNQRRFALIGRGFGSDAFNESVQDTIGSILVDSSEINFTYTDATPSITAALIDASITFARLQNADALSVLGRSANSAGVLNEIAGTASQVLRVKSGGTALAFQSSAALTKTDDTNVTLTLGGTPTTALLDATSLTLGWTGTLAVARGGLGVGTVTGLLQGNGTSAVSAITNSTTVGQVLRVTGANTYAWGALDLADGDAITGDLPDANLSANVPLLNVANTFTGAIVIGPFNNNHLELQTSAANYGWRLDTNAAGVIPLKLSRKVDNVYSQVFSISNDTGVLDFNFVPTINGVADFARLSQANTFTATQTIASTSPTLTLDETDAGSNERLWRWISSGGDLFLLARTDADGAGTTPVALTRTGTTIDSIDFTATAITLNGATTMGAASTTPTHNLNTSTATGATAGADTLPANPVAFITMNINGTARKIPYYAT